MGGRLTIGSISGIEIRIHRSWFFIALLIAWSFWSRFRLADHGTATALAMALVAAILFFSSILAHELAHSLEAQHRGAQVRGITLFLFGGATETSFDVDRPRDEFALTAVGPLTSFVLAALFGVVATYSARAGLDVIAEVAGHLGWVNLALGVFNLLPGAPLDGGRIVRSAVWAITGDRRRGVRVAARAGQVLGVSIAGLGLLQLFLVPGGFVGGLWLMFIGWFLAVAAQSEVAQQELGERLGGLTVGALARERALASVDAATDLATAAEQLRRQADDALTVEQDGRATGVLLLGDVAEVPEDRRSERSVGELAVPIDELPSVDGETEVVEALGQLRGDRPLAVTTEGGDRTRVEGVITPEQLQRVVTRTLRLGSGGGRGRRGTAAAPAGHIPGKDRS